jgi:hypothetical protein
MNQNSPSHLRILTVFALLTLWMERAPAHPGSGIAVDERGRVYFADTREGLWRVDAGGRLTLMKKGGLHWMTMDRRGTFANSADEFGPFTRLTPQREKPVLIGCPEFPCAMGKDGNLFYASMHDLTIIRRSPSGEESVLVEKDRFRMKDDTSVTGIACGPDGTLYLVALDSLNRKDGHGLHMIWAVKPDGTIRKFADGFLKQKDKLPAAEQHWQVRPEYCRGIAVDGNGDVYVAVTGNRCVMKLTAKGEASVVHRTAKPWTPTGVDVVEGEVYVLEYDDETPAKHGDWPPRVKKVGTNGKVATVATVARE